MAARLSALIALLFALVAAWLLLSPANLPTQRSLKPQGDTWQLNLPVTIESDAALSVIAQTRLWGGGVGAGTAPLPTDEAPLTAPDWRISGVYSEGSGKNVALLSFDGLPLAAQQQQQLRVGDKLPGGAKILAITPDRVCILLNGKKRSISTYRE